MVIQHIINNEYFNSSLVRGFFEVEQPLSLAISRPFIDVISLISFIVF